MACTSASGDDEPPPAKRRKLAEPKPRTTQHLDLRLGEVDASQKSQLDRLLKVLHKKRKIVVIAGAGISVSAGIPDFRSSTGLFKELRSQHNLKSSGKDLFDASVYQDDSSTSSFHDMVRSLSAKTKSAQPTAFHHLLATLAHEGRLLRLYSQNVDGIDTALEPLKTEVPLPKKAPWPKTIQLHGGLDKMVCSKCHKLSEFKAELFDGPIPPSCTECEENDGVRAVAGKRSHGIGRLRPRMVLYNEHNPDDEAIGSVTRMDLRTRPDAVIVAGTTLKVPGVRRITREMCGVVRDRRDGVTIWINNDPEPIGKDLENCWDLVVRGPCDEVARHAAMRRWDDKSEYKEVTEEELRRVREESRKVEVVVISPTKIKAFEQVQGQLVTPVASPRMLPRESIGFPPSNQDPSTPTKKRKSIQTIKVAVTVDPTKPTKAAPKKRTSQPKKATIAKSTANKITNAFTVSKAVTKQSGKVKANPDRDASANSKPKPQSRCKKIEVPNAPAPMAPISPQAARNNTSPPYAPPTPNRIPNQGKSEMDEYKSPSSDQIRPVNERREGTISPRGTLPSDLARLVDL